MKIKPIHAFIGVTALTAFVAAARFTGGTPVDQTLTYQGQVRSAGQLVNGTVDLRMTLWDADTGGAQIGSASTFNALQLSDGRFACGLSFGNAAIDGTDRWIQTEFRNPAGNGQYLALSPPRGQDHGDAICALRAERRQWRVGLRHEPAVRERHGQEGRHRDEQPGCGAGGGECGGRG